MSSAKVNEIREAAVEKFVEGNYSAALPMFQEALAEAKNLSGEEGSKLQLSCHLNIASCCVKESKFDQAVEAATEALAIDKKSHKALFRRGQARRQLKQFSKARIDLVMAMELTDDKGIKAELDALRAEQSAAGGGSSTGAPPPGLYGAGPAAGGQRKVRAPPSGADTDAQLEEMMAAMRGGGAPPAAAGAALVPKKFTPDTTMQALIDKADSGDKDAQFKLGECFDDGKLGFPKCPVQSFERYLQASKQGHGTATRFAAWALKTGTGVKADMKKAIELYSEAAETHKDTKAMACLGFCFDKGDGVGEDLPAAVKWYTMAAEQGDNVAQVNLALCFEKGRGTEKDMAKALDWHRKAAEQGNMNAVINVGLYYEKGDGGVAKDMPTAFSWYLKAANAGDATGQAVTGWCYEKGEGVAVDTELALDWYVKGAQQKNQHAQQGLQRLMKEKGYA